MAIQHFSASVRVREQVAIIDLHGEIDANAEDSLHSAYNEAEEEDMRSILLNFADVHYINSTGIALIVSLLSRAQRAQRTLLACGLSEHYVEIFHITRLVDFMKIFPNEESALQASLSS